MLKRLLLLCMLLSVSIHVSAQGAKKISGKVTDEATGETLVGAAILESGSSNGTTSNIDGTYSLSINGNKLSISYVGYVTQEITVGESNQVNIALASDTKLDGIVVVGYTSQKKSSITGAISPMNMNDMGKRHTLSVTQAMQGQVAGVQITQSTGAPGDDINVMIRGEGTIGNNNPLYIIDGIPSRSISFLNPSDINSVTVLKDASAAAIYGSRASGGVIVITTKEGELGKSNVELTYSYGLQRAINLPKMLNAKQYLEVKERALNNSGYTGVNPYPADANRPDLSDTDWQKELFNTGKTHNLQATINGGTQKTKYLLSTGYIGQDGIVIFNNDKYQRLNMRFNLNTKLNDRLTVGTNVQLTYAIQDKLNSKGDAPGIIRHAMLRPPVLGVYKNQNDPTYNPDDPFTDLPFYKHNGNGGWEDAKYEKTANPIAYAKYSDNKQSRYTTFGNVFLEYALLSDQTLKFRSNVGIDMNMFHNKDFKVNFGDDDGTGTDVDKGKPRQNRPSNLNEERGESRTITWNNTFNYNKVIGKHSINALAGTEFITNFDSSIGASRQRFDYTYPTLRYLDMGGSLTNVNNSGSASEWALLSFFASTTYVYNNRYMLTANIRSDASSRFAKKNQWGYFPSLSLGWKISEEDFMKNLTWLSDLKVRGSWGQLGNQEIDNYAFLTLMKKEGEIYKKSRYGNLDLKWETSEQANIGLDLGILRNKFYLSVDYFKKTTSDILLPISLPSYVGDVDPTIVNAGVVVNKGLEIALTYRDQIGDFRYSINTNLATLDNLVTKLHTNSSLEGLVTRTVVGQPLNSYYGFQMEGIYQNIDEVKAHLSNTNRPTAQPGDIKFKDLDGNGQIDDNDRTFLGSMTPNLSYGFTLNGEYKGFNLSMFFHGISGAERFNELKKILDYDSRPFNSTTKVLDSWNGEGSSNTIPRPSFSDNGGSRISDIFVEDASFFRCKNIELGYSFAEQLKKSKSKLADIRIYITAENLFTSTSYSGLDPESTDLIDYGTYPQAQSFLFGINIKF